METAKVFVPTEIYRKALCQWSEKNVIVLSGEPGVGKTTLAYMLALAHLQRKNLNGFVWANSIADVLDMLQDVQDEQKQVFILDDFWDSILHGERLHGHYEKRLERLHVLEYKWNGKQNGKIYKRYTC